MRRLFNKWDLKIRKQISNTIKQLIKDRGDHWSKGQISHRKNTTLNEEYDINKADSIREKSSIAAKNRNKSVCKYCKIKMDVSHLNKYHNEKCIHHNDINKANDNKNKRLLTCPHCLKLKKFQG